MKKTIFVIGAGAGLGNGVAERFGAEGFRVVLMARNEARLQEYAKAFSAKGIETETRVADAADFGGMARALQEAVQSCGTPDALFYNVGVTVPDEGQRIDAQTLMERYAADVAGAYNCVSLIGTDAFAAKNGAILITGGGLALQPYAAYLPLSMDKAALRAMVQALAPFLEARGVYIGTVQVTGAIGSNEHFAPKTIAEKFWELYDRRETHEIVY